MAAFCARVGLCGAVAQMARNTGVYGACGVLCWSFGRVGEWEGYALMHADASTCCVGVKCSVKWRWLLAVLGGLNRGWGSGANRVRFVLKMGLEIQLGVLWRILSTPHKDKISD